MARGKVTVRKSDDNELEEDQIESIDMLIKARSVAALVFANAEPTTEQIFGSFDRMDLDEDDVESLAFGLKKAAETAREIFGETSGTEEIFGVFDRVFEEIEEE